MAVTRLSDLIVPEAYDVITDNVVALTETKLNILKSGIVTKSAALDQALSGGGKIFNERSYRDLDDEEANISNDDPNAVSIPGNITMQEEQQVRLSRNKSWSSMDINAEYLGTSDPILAITQLISGYWSRHLQRTFIATVQGVFADNDEAPEANEHVQGDLTHDISALTGDAAKISASALLDTFVTMGDSMGNLSGILCHSITYRRLQELNLVDTIPNNLADIGFGTYMGKSIIVDDSLPNPAGSPNNGSQTASGVYHTWAFGSGTFAWGQGTAKVPTEIERKADAGNGGGQDVLHSRQEYAIHPVGHAYVGTAPVGGPSNYATTNNLAHSGSWSRVYRERKQIKIARLISKEN